MRRLIALLTSGCVGAAIFLLTGTASANPRVSGPVAEEMGRLLKLQPGGVQVSDNALIWNKGATVVVFPSPGENVAPRGLGANVRYDALRAIDAEELANDVGVMDVHGCPSGVLKKDYYCFYTDRDFGGRRLQFAETCTGNAGNWDFDNQTSSWVNTGTNKTIYAHDYNSENLWYEPQNSVNTFVGTGDNDRMDYWSCGQG